MHIPTYIPMHMPMHMPILLTAGEGGPKATPPLLVYSIGMCIGILACILAYMYMSMAMPTIAWGEICVPIWVT